ncbi:MAG: LPS assembly protein LptD, partial [Thermodesulfobacteriota bacterium]
QVGLRETIYWTNENDKFDNRSLYDFSLSLQTTFLKIFNLEDNNKIKHSIRPNVTYSFIPDVDQTGLPNFDDKDSVARENKVTYSLTSFLTNKWFEKKDTSPSYRDTVFLEVSQSFDINEARSNSTTPEDEKRPFSDLKVEMILTPDDRIYFKGEGEYNVYSSQVSTYDLSMILKDRRGDKLDVGYSYNRNVANYLDLDINVNIFKGLDFFHSSRFSFLDANTKTLETTYGIDYQRQCWGIRLSRVEISAENVYYLTLNLLGLGEVGKASAGFNK